MSDDPRITYLNARAAYEAALKVTKAHGRMFTMLGEQITRAPQTFIEGTIQGKNSTIYTRLDLSKWPSAEVLQRDVLALESAYGKCRLHWDALPADSRGGCVAPPSRLGAE